MNEQDAQRFARLEHDHEVTLEALGKALDLLREMDAQLIDVGLVLPSPLRERVRKALK